MATAATEVGSLHLVLGKVIARDPQGNERTLSNGDSVRLNEQIITGSDGVAHIDMIDGKVIVLYERDGLSLAEYLEQNGFRFAGETGPDEIRDILAAFTGNEGGIAESEFSISDLENLPPPAAGEDGDGGLDEGILLELNSQSIQAVADFDSFIPLEPLQDAPPADENEDELPISDVEAIAPTGAVQNVLGDEDTAIALNISASLVDIDGSEVLTLSLSGIPEGSVLTDGNFNITADGNAIDISAWDLSSTTLTPPLNFNGSLTLSFTATATELNGGDQAASAQSFIVAVNPVNDAPIAEVIGPVTSDEDSAILAIELLQTASDVDEDDLDVNSVAVNVASGVAPETDIVFAINEETGLLLLDPAQFGYLADSESITLTFVYNVNDGTVDVANTATVTIEGRNDQPVVTDVTLAELSEDEDLLEDNGQEAAKFEGTLSVTDADITDAHTFSLVDASVITDDGETGAVDPAKTIVTVNSDGSYSVVNPDFNALAEGEVVTVSFRYIATDDSGTGSAASDEKTVTLTITGSNDQPVVENVIFTALAEDNDLLDEDSQEDARFEGTLSVADEDTTDAHTFSLVANSVSTDDGEISVVDSSSTVVTVNGDGTYSVVNPDFNALADGETVTVTFRYIATDDSGTGSAASDEKTVTLTITGNNDQPEIQNVTLSDLSEDGSLVADDGQEAARFEGSLPSVSDEDTTDTHSYSLVAESVTTDDGETGAVDPAKTIVTVNSDGSYSVVNPDFNALAEGEVVTVSFRYIATDDSGTGSAASDEKTVTLAITGSNDQPVVENVIFSALTEDNDLLDEDSQEDARFEGTLSVADEDTTDAHTFSLVANSVSTDDGELDVVDSSNTVVTVNGDGSYSVVNPDFNALADGEMVTVTFRYIATDNSGTDSAASDEKTVTLTITGNNDQPVVEDITLTNLTEDGSLVADDGQEASRFEGSLPSVSDEDTTDTHSYSLVAESVTTDDSETGVVDSAKTLVTVNSDGSYSVVNPDFNALADGETVTVTFRYIATDDSGTGSAASDEKTVTLAITGSNDQPVVENVIFTALAEDNDLLDEDSQEDARFEGTLSVADEDTTDAHTFSLVANSVSTDDGEISVVDSSNTVVTVNGDGTYSVVNPDFNALADGETATVTFRYIATDDSGTDSAASDEKTVTLTITGNNDQPEIQNVTLSDLSEDGSLVADDGQEAARFEGSLPSVSDEDTTDTHSYSLVAESVTTNDNEMGVVDAANTAVTVNTDGGYSVVNPDFNALADGESVTVTFRYIATDDSGTDSASSEEKTVTLTITGNNDQPVIEDVTLSNLTEDGNLVENDGLEAARFTGSLSVSDEDSTDSHTFSLVAESVSTNDGELDVVNPENTSVTINPDGSYSVINPDFNRLDEDESVTVTFDYIATDDSGTSSASSDAKTVTLTISGSNDTPVAVADVDLSTEENSVLMVDVLANDTDEDDSDTPENFTLKSVALSQEGTGTVSIENNQLKFDPGADFDFLASGESTAVTVSYTMADDSGAESSSTATITVTGLNDPAVIEDVFNGFSGNVVENSVPGSKVTGQLSATDVDNSNADGFQAKSINGLFGTLVMQANGVWEYTLNNNHPVVDALNTDSPDLEDIITVHSIDGTPAEISITIAGSNDAPVVTETPINLNSTDEDQGIVITQQQLLAGSTDVDNALEDLSAENLSISSVSSGSGSLSYDPLSQSWTFKPSKDWSGQVTFNFDVSDGVDSTPSTATLTVDPVADKPILNVSNTSGNEDTAVALNIQAMLSDQDGSELLSPVSISNIPPGWQFINAQGELAVSVGILVLNPGDEVGLKAIPPLNYSGTHTFTVSVASNEQNSTSSELVQKPLEVEILPVAEPADLVVPASTSGNEDTPIDLSGIQVSVGDTGDTNEQVTQLILKGMPVGSVVSDGQQSVTITPSDVEMDILSWNLAQLTILPPENSDSDFQLQVTAVTRDGDSEATTDPQIISVNVVPVLDAPTVDLLYTNDPEPTLTGQVALGENEILQVLVNGQLFTAGVGSAPLKVDGDGQWSLDMAGNPLPADGVYEVTATVLNPSLDPNSIQDSTQNELVFDTRAPKGTVVFNHKTNDSTPEISGKLKATLGADEYLKVTVNGKTYVNREFPEQEEGVQLVEFIMGEDDRSWYFSIPDQDSINSSDEFGTEFEVEANVVDRAGNESPPDTADLLVDVNSPEIAPGSLVFSTGESINSVEATKTFKVSGMTDGAEQGQKVQIKLYQGDTEFNYEASVRADGSFVLTLYPQNPEHDSGRGIDLESFDDGTIQIDARVTDKLGNPSPVETDSTVLDTSLSGTEITIEAISNDSGVDNDFRTHDFDGLTLTGSLNQALTEDESLQISMDKGRTWLNSVTVNGQDWSYTEAEGTSRTNGQKVNYWLRVVDEAGNLAPQEEYAVQQVVFDNHAVITSLSLNKSGDISWNEAGSLVKVNGRTQGVESGQSVSIKLTGLIAGVATEYSYTTLVDNGRFTLELEQAFLRQFDDDSSVSFEASTNDLSDNQADQQHSVTLDFTVPGDTDGDHEPDNLGKPVVTLLGPDDGYINEGENTGGFKVLVSLPEGVEVGDRVRLSLKQVGGQSESIDYFVTAEDLLDDQAEVMIPERLLADGWTDGEYKINARISDDAGNTSKKGPAYLFTLDTTSPEADMTGPGQVNSQPFTTIFSLSDTRYTDENEWPELLPGDFNVENGVIESVTDLGNGQYELKIKPAFDPGVDQGNISIQLAADAVEDNAGNGNEFFEETITYDNDDPVIMLSSGLTGEVFNTNSSIPNLQAAFDLIQNNQPDASFTATKIDYSDNSAPTLAEFLGDGAEDLTGDTTANVETMAFRLSGQIELGVGTHSFRITSDDGFILRINGQEVAKYEGLRSAAPTAGTYTVDVNEGGAQSFELIYFENAVNAVLKVEIDRGNGYEILDQSSTLKNSTSYMEGNGAISLNQGLRLSDTDDTELAGAEVKIINFQQGEDVLDFTAANGISVESYDSQTGVLRLSGKASIAAYESALAAVTYENTSEDPLAGQRLLSVKINDGHTWSDPVTTTLTVFAINDAPEMAVQSLPLDYVENDGYQTLDSNLSLSDVDNENLHSVTIRISEGYVNGQERLELDNSLYDSAKISALWNGQGFLKLTAKDPVNNPVSVSEFEALLRQVQYQNSSDNPVEGARTVSWIANDGQDDSLTVESTINVTAENDSAYVTQVRNWTYEENSGQVVLDNALTLVDPDSTHIKSVTVSISKNYDADHDLLRVLSEQPDVSVNWNALTGTLSITALNPAGLEKQAFEQVLETITFTSTGDNPSTAQRELTWKVNDGQGDGQSVVSRISIRALNDAPENYFDENELSSDALNLAQSPIQATEDTVLLIDQLSIQDADANDEAIRVTLQVEHGRLSMGSSDGLSLNGQDSNSLTLQGSQKAINQALKTLTYQGLPDYNGSDKLVMISNDRGNNGNGGTQETRSEIAIDVAAVNDKPLLATSSGLKVEVFDVSPVSESAFNSLSEVLTFMDDEAPDATFLAHTLAFDDGNPDTLSQFIGNNGSELSGLGDEPFESMGLRFTGQIKLDAGDHNFTVRSDDGFSLKINGQVVTEFDRDRGAGNSSGRFSANTDGLYDIEIVYWENRGSAVLEVSMDGQILDASLLFSNSQIEQTYQEGQTEPTQLFEGMMLSDVDGTLESLVVEITGDFDQQSDLYQAQLPAGIIRQDNYENGVLTVTFSGTAPVAAYQALLSSIHYENTSDDPVEGDREIRVWAHDGELDSDVLNATLTVTAENDHPVAQGFVIEPVSETVDFSQYVSDPDHSDAQLQVIIEQLPEYGRLFLQHNGTEQNVEVSDLGTTQYNLDDLNYEVADLDLGTASQPGMQGWGILNNDGNVLTSTHGNVTVTTSTQNGEFQQYNQPGHVGIGLGIKNHGIKRSNAISVQYSAAIAFAVIGVDGLGGHFDAGASQKGAVKVSVTFEDGSQGTWSFNKAQLGISDSDYSASISVGHGSQHLINTEGLGIVQMDFSAASNNSLSNWVLSSIESSVSDSFSYKAVDPDDAVSVVQTVNIKGGAISGTEADDLITGTTADDVLIGNGGADTFQFTLNNLLEEDSVQIDRILDFKVGNTSGDTEADYLDLSDLLVTENTSDIAQFISDITAEGLTVTVNQDNTVIEFNSTADSDLQTLHIVLDGVSTEWGVNASDEDVITQLISNGQLIV